MSPARKLCMVVFLSIGLAAARQAAGQIKPVQGQIQEHEQKLAGARAARHSSDEGLELIILGYLYRQAGEMQRALADLNDALAIEESSGNKAAQAMAQNTMGKIYADQGLEDKALDSYKQALLIWGALRMRAGAAITLNYVAMAYNNLGQQEEALRNLNEALIWSDPVNHCTAVGCFLFFKDRASGSLGRLSDD